MKSEEKLLEGVLLKRYKRFFADVDLNGQVVLAHVPNSGSMKGCSDAHSKCRLSFSDDPKRKLKYTLEMVKSKNSWVGVNTSRPNHLVFDLWQRGLYKPWLQFDRAQREVKISSQSRIDLVLWNSKNEIEKLVKPDFRQIKNLHFVEVKNVSLADGAGLAMFPDSITLRGQKHIDELLTLIQLGHTAEMVYVVQREDCHSFSPAIDIDPVYSRKLVEALEKGLKISVFSCSLTNVGVQIKPKPLQIKM